MNLIKCPNGHFYDASKFQSCPHCSGGNNDVTVSVNPQRDLETVAVNSDQDAKTLPLQPEKPPVTVTPQPAFGAGQIPAVTPPVAPPVGQPAVPQAATAGLDALSKRSTANSNDDDVETIGYYQTASADSADQSAPKKRIDPVVGWLVIANGEERGKSVQLKAGRNFIGRAKSNDIALTGDNTISREKHAIIVFEPRTQTFLLQPGTSKELFYVNDEVVLDTKKIDAYDVLSIGKTNLIFIPFCGESFSWNNDEDEK